jgi:pyruvate dehydrogenase E2 component (dihydrolipoamide acetyltransferase)
MDNRNMEVVMPKVGLTMTEGAITEWHKREGDAVRKGELLFTFETEKSTLEYESPEEGVITQILVHIGQTVACFTPVAVLAEGGPSVGGASASSGGEAKGRQAASPRARMRARELGVDLEAIAGTGPGGAVRERDVASALDAPTANRGVDDGTGAEGRKSKGATPTPLAQRLAAELGVDLRNVDGSGPDGKVTRADVERAARLSEESKPTGGEHKTQPAASEIQPSAVGPQASAASLSPARRVTAQRMAANAQVAPHVTLTTEVDATELVSARNQINAELRDKVSYNALLVAICARAMKDHPGMNASWVDGPPAGIVVHDAIHIGLAVDTPRGLFVPVLKDCAGKPLARIHAELTDLVSRTTEGRARPDELSGGTFTITNLGMFDIDAFTPIINLPEAAILGVGRIVTKPAANGDQIALRQMLALSLSFDHRVIDGAPAAKFLQRVKQLIERPFALML